MQRSKMFFVFISLALVLLFTASPVLAQDEQPPAPVEELQLFTDFPSQVIGIGETATFDLTLRAGSSGEIVRLEMAEIPEGWTATFRGGGKIVQAVYVQPGDDASVDLRLEPPANVEPGEYRFVVLADGSEEVELPIDLSIREKLPPRLSFEVELPTLRGSPSTTFRYNATVENEGDEELSVSLIADAPAGFQVNFQLTGQDVTTLPLAANESKRISIEAQPITDLPAGSYPINVLAQGGEAEATLALLAEVTGQSELTVTAPDGRLSGQAYAGRETPLKVILRNNGTAPARGVELSSSEPTGWSVTFEPDQIPEIPAGQQVEVTANLRPAEQAVAGDYMLTVRANPADGANKSADFRITVLTSTLWGIAGVALIAVAVGVVAIAVVRFGRR